MTSSLTWRTQLQDAGRVFGVAEPSAVKCLVDKLMCISLMALEIHFSDTGGRRESLEQMDSGPSLEDIIVSMQHHLRCSVEGSDVVYDRSRGNGAGGIGRGFNAESGGVTDASQLSQTVYTAPWTYANTTDGIYGDGDASECDEVPLPVLTREMLRRHTYAENECTVTDADHVQVCEWVLR